MAINQGDKVRVHYRGTLDDGSEFDSSYSRGEPIAFEIGSGGVIEGFDDAVSGMDVGDKLRVTIPSGKAYGPRHDEAVQEIPADQIPPGASVGDMLSGQTEDGHQVAAELVNLDDGSATLDFNHPLAGKDLTFELERVEVVS
jgi:FKBP-type peptidyl-prolyl cis-trans isomerase 2